MGSPIVVLRSGTYEVFSVREDGHVKWLPAGSDSPSVTWFDSADDAAYATRHEKGSMIFREVSSQTRGTWYTGPKPPANAAAPDHPVPNVPGASAPVSILPNFGGEVYFQACLLYP